MELDQITGEILDAAMHIHRNVGPGLLETAYEQLLAIELERRGLHVERQKRVALELDGMYFQEAFRLDLLVEQQVVVEIKAVEELARLHWRQVLTYLRLLDLRVGLLINFSCDTLMEGYKRIVNRYVDSAPRRLSVKRPSAAGTPEDVTPPAAPS